MMDDETENVMNGDVMWYYIFSWIVRDSAAQIRPKP